MKSPVVFLALFFAASMADDATNSSNEFLQKNIACDLEQKALHLSLRCSISPSYCGVWDQCSVNIDLSRGVYANPYELSDKLPEVKFTIARKATREPSGLSRFFFSKKSVESESKQEISLNASEVDIEAPSWKSDSMRWKFALDSQRQIWGSNAAIELTIPLHLRYNLPSPSGKPTSGIVSRSLIDCCAKGTGGQVGQHRAIVPSGCSSDLLLVMPLTLILLVIGMIILLLH